MSGLVLDVHGSAGTTAEPGAQLRLVMAPPAGEADGVTNHALISSFIEAEKHSEALGERNEKPPSSDANYSLPADDDDDDDRVATEGEVRDLLHVVDRIPARLWVACLAGILERFVWYGATAPLRE